MNRFQCLGPVVCLFLVRAALAQEALPTPKKSVTPTRVLPTAPEPRVDAPEPVVVGNLEHKGFALWGPSGRHYFFGGLAVADYVDGGERRIVTLQQEEPTLLPKPDDKFLYYRELNSGHRWAIGRHPLTDGTYVIFFQPSKEASEKTVPIASKRPWKEFQRSRLQRSKEVSSQVLKMSTPMTGHHW